MGLGIEKIKKLFTKDNRRTERLVLPITMHYSTQNPPTESSWIGPIQTGDVGGGGLRFITDKKFKKGTELILRLQLPHHADPITVQAEVVWLDKTVKDREPAYSIGVEFRKINAEDRQEYVNFICDKILTNYLTAEGLVK